MPGDRGVVVSGRPHVRTDVLTTLRPSAVWVGGELRLAVTQIDGVRAVAGEAVAMLRAELAAQRIALASDAVLKLRSRTSTFAAHQVGVGKRRSGR